MVQKKMIKSTNEKFEVTVETYLRTILLFFSWLVLGICSEIIGPTMGILARNTNVTFNGIASALSSRSAAGFLTNIICGICQNFVNNYQDLMLTIGFFASAILVSFTPFIKSLLLMCILFFIHGIAATLANMGGTKLLFKEWHNHVAAPMNIVHMGYSLGAIVANLLVRPFLGTKSFHMHINESSSSINSTLSTSVSVPIDADIRIPYVITGGLCFLIGIGHLFFLLKKHYQKQDQIEKEQVNYGPVKTNVLKNEIDSKEKKYSEYSPSTCGHGYFSYGLSLSIVLTLLIFFTGGTDQTFAKFYFSYLKFDQFNISTENASWGIILFWIAFSISRILCAVASVFLSVSVCLSIAWFQGLIVALAWIIYVWVIGLSMTSLFVLGSFTGFVIGPLFPLSFAWINEKLNVIPLLLAALFCGGGLGSLILQKIGGFVMDRDPNHFPTLITACVITAIILYIVSNLIIFFHQRTINQKEDQVGDDDSLTSNKLNEDEKQMTTYLQTVNETQ